MTNITSNKSGCNNRIHGKRCGCFGRTFKTITPTDSNKPVQHIWVCSRCGGYVDKVAGFKKY